MPSLRKLGQFAETMLQDHLRRRQMQDQNDMVTERQAELARLQDELRRATAEDSFTNTILSRLTSDPQMADRVAQSGVTEVGGLPISSFVQSDQQRTLPLLDEVGKAKTFHDLGDKETLFERRRQRGPITSLTDISGLLNSYDSAHEKIGMNNEFEDDRALAMKEGEAYSSAKGTEQAAAEFAPAQLERKVAEFERMSPLEFAQFEKERRLQAAIDLNKEITIAKQKAAMEADTNAMKMLQNMANEAAMGVQAIEEISALAADINWRYDEGTIDTYAGMKDAVGSLPMIGDSLRGGMSTASGWIAGKVDNDPTLPRKISRLEGLRREAAIKLIRMAGDPRPSDADVKGVIPVLPGAMESKQATAEKTQYIRDVTTALPQVMAENPGITGIALLNLAMARAKTRSAERAGARPAQTQTPITNPAPNGAVPPSGNPLLSEAQRILNGR
jgi:hypothetical protein